jgi:hypothetical protein
VLQIGAVTHVVALHRVAGDRLRPLVEIPSFFPDPILVEAVPEPLPRAYAVGGVRVADGIHGLMALVDPKFDPRREIVLPEGRPVAAPEGFRGHVHPLQSASRVLLDAELERTATSSSWTVTIRLAGARGRPSVPPPGERGLPRGRRRQPAHGGDVTVAGRSPASVSGITAWLCGGPPLDSRAPLSRSPTPRLLSAARPNAAQPPVRPVGASWSCRRELLLPTGEGATVDVSPSSTTTWI